MILLYFSIWISFYFALCFWKPSRSCEWHCRTVTVLHAVTVTLIAIYVVFILGPSPFTHAGGRNTPAQVMAVSICLAYFLFDLGWCLYFRTEGPVMLAHHFLSIIGLSWCLFAGYYGTELVATIGGAEITNPLLQLRWFLRESGHYKSLLGDIVDWTFIMSFGFVRILLGSVLLYSYYQQNTDFWGRLGGTCIYSIGWIFFIGILNYAVKKYSRRFKNWKHKPAQTTLVSSSQLSQAATSKGSDKCAGTTSHVKPANGKNSFCQEERNILSVREIKNGSSGLFARNVSRAEDFMNHSL
ncbi:transmembrane protein 136 [Biomphalaria pfeifferi]|uniref:Transmembrane protein 136 n=1 Tax=Biomphalaria pfeifferi TaxID=112525 RepID=A0AAD8BPN4_BIOPF|nr:transmembrane protein 136 [Biomphalaria pfeifferi]